jgi:hypothetical protein
MANQNYYLEDSVKPNYILHKSTLLMKPTLLILLVALFLQSCKKEPLQTQPDKQVNNQADYNKMLTFGTGNGAQRGWWPPIWLNTQIGRLSWWMLSDQNNQGVSRMDFCELLYSDNFLSDIDGNDMVKVVDSTDNMAIKDTLTRSLLWREQKFYKHCNDTVILKTWNYTKGSYYFKFMGSNFPTYPETFTAVLVDKFTGAVIDIPTQNNEVVWYQFSVEDGKKSRDPKRFYIVLREEFI